MSRCGSTSASPLAAATLLFIILVAGCAGFHGAVAARLLPSSVPVPALAHQAQNGVKAAGAADCGLVLQEGGGVGNGDDELSSIPEVRTEAEDEEACEEAGNDDECMQRRLLRDAHLDYIYTQHKGKP